MSLRAFLLTVAFVAACPLLPVSPTVGQSLEIEPAAPTLEVGARQQLEAFYVSPDGNRRRDTTVVFFSRDGQAAPTTRGGTVTAAEPGTHEIVALRPATDAQDRIVKRVTVTVQQGAVSSVAFEHLPERVYVGTRVPVSVVATTANGRTRADVQATVESSDDDVATVDAHQRLRGVAPGSVTLTATAKDRQATATVEIVENPVVSIELTGGPDSARTGDVIDFGAAARDSEGTPVEDAPIRFAVRTEDTEAIVPGAAAEVDDEGRFVAEEPGRYTVVATSGSHVAEHTVAVQPRGLTGEIEVVGRGRVTDVHTSDLWV